MAMQHPPTLISIGKDTRLQFKHNFIRRMIAKMKSRKNGFGQA